MAPCSGAKCRSLAIPPNATVCSILEQPDGALKGHGGERGRAARGWRRAARGERHGAARRLDNAHNSRGQDVHIPVNAPQLNKLVLAIRYSAGRTLATVATLFVSMMPHMVRG